MAVTTTPKELMEWAYAYSTKNNPGAIATESVELFQLVIRTIRKFYTIAARVNPTYFATKSVVSAPGAGQPWVRPEGAESIYRLEKADGTEIVVVPHNHRNAESGKPGVYREQKKFYEAGNANDPNPATDAIHFFHSKRPTDPADYESVIDTDWEEQFNDLLVLEIACYLANKDGRPEELTFLKTLRDESFRLFILFLEHETACEVRSRGHLRRINTESLIPLTDLLIGGTTVKIDRGGN